MLRFSLEPTLLAEFNDGKNSINLPPMKAMQKHKMDRLCAAAGD
jgi:hypothetical protein